MNAFLIILTCVVSGCLFVVTEQRVSRVPCNRGWQIVFWALAVFGVGLGIWFASIRYFKTPTLRLYGFPFAVAGAEFVNGRWLNGLVGHPLAFVADVGAALAICLLPLLAATLLNRNRNEKDAERRQ